MTSDNTPLHNIAYAPFNEILTKYFGALSTASIIIRQLLLYDSFKLNEKRQLSVILSTGWTTTHTVNIVHRRTIF